MIENEMETARQLRGSTRWYRGQKAHVLAVENGFAAVLYADGSSGQVPVGALLDDPQPAQRYRVGRHQPQNIYDGDKYIGVMFSAPHAARVVDALNRGEHEVAAEKWLT